MFALFLARTRNPKGLFSHRFHSRHHWIVAFCVLTAAFCLLANSYELRAAESKAGAWEITADRITRQSNPEVIVGEGNVVLKRVEQEDVSSLLLKADWVKYNVDEGIAHAGGNLSMLSAKEDVKAEEVMLNINDETATLKDATIFMPDTNLHFSGQEVEKKGPITYHFKNCSFTTCPIEEGKASPWRFSASDATVKTEGVTVLKHTVLRVKDIPVFYSPYLAFPVYQKRKTGFLLPEFSQSNRSGTGIVTPFFVDISPSSDITLYPGYMEKRGITVGAEMRYAAGYRSQGNFAFTYQYDKTEDEIGDDYKDDGYLRTEQHRYWIRGKADHDLGNNLNAKLDIDLVSDRDYLQEFESGIAGFDASNTIFLDEFNRGFDEQTIPYRSSRLNVSKTYNSSFLGGQLVGVDDNDKENDNIEGTEVHTLPRLIYDGVMNIPNSDLHLTWNGNYVNYYPEEGIGENRLDLHPRIVSPLPLGGVIEGSVSTGVRETLYSISSHGSDWDWEADSSQIRSSWDVKGELATTLARNYQGDFGRYSWLRHSVRPELEYAYVSVNQQDDLPAIDNVDALTRTNIFRYGVNNFFWAGGTDSEGSLLQRYIGFLKITQNYDVREARRDTDGPGDKRRPFSDINLTLDTYPLPRWQLKYETDYSVYGEGFTQYNLYSRYTSSRGDKFYLDYRYEKYTEVSEINAAIQARVTDTFYLEGEVRHSFFTDETVRSSIGIVYHPECWAVELRAEDTPDDDRVSLMFSLVGLGEKLGIGLSSDLGEGGLELSSGAGIGEIDFEDFD